MKRVRSVLRTVARRVILPALGPRFARHDGAILPPRHLRFCGFEFRDHGYFLQSARAEADRLVQHCGLSGSSRVVDLGCGSGRLAIALRERFPSLGSYLGIDVHKPSVDWCSRWLTDQQGRFRFQWINRRNARYNPQGGLHPDGNALPCETASADVVNLFSVFSHMEQSDIELYVRELKRILAPGGSVFLTAFVSTKQIRDVEVNPAEGRLRWQGPLHCVQLRHAWFTALLREHGLSWQSGPEGEEVDGQTAFYLRHAAVPADWSEVVIPGDLRSRQRELAAEFEITPGGSR